MVRFLVRVLGLLVLAAGFVGLVVDATRSIANSRASFTPLGELAKTVFPSTFPLIEPGVTRNVHPLLWDPVLTTLFLLPASVLAFALGALLLWAGQKPAEPIGYRAEG